MRTQNEGVPLDGASFETRSESVLVLAPRKALLLPVHNKNKNILERRFEILFADTSE